MPIGKFSLDEVMPQSGAKAPMGKQPGPPTGPPEAEAQGQAKVYRSFSNRYSYKMAIYNSDKGALETASY